MNRGQFSKICSCDPSVAAAATDERTRTISIESKYDWIDGVRSWAKSKQFHVNSELIKDLSSAGRHWQGTRSRHSSSCRRGCNFRPNCVTASPTTHAEVCWSFGDSCRRRITISYALAMRIQHTLTRLTSCTRRVHSKF